MDEENVYTINELCIVIYNLLPNPHIPYVCGDGEIQKMNVS